MKAKKEEHVSYLATIERWMLDEYRDRVREWGEDADDMTRLVEAWADHMDTDAPFVEEEHVAWDAAYNVTEFMANRPNRVGKSSLPKGGRRGSN